MRTKRKPLPLCWLEVRWKENPALIGVKTFDSFNEAVAYGLGLQEEFGWEVDLWACFEDGGEFKVRLEVIEKLGLEE